MCADSESLNWEMKRKVPLLSLLVRRRRGLALRLAALLTAAAALHAARWLAARAARALALPPPGRALDHFAVNRDLKRYLDNISVLIEPSSTACSRGQRLPVLALVTSAPQRVAQRQAIRDTWAKHLPTYFALGLDGPSTEDLEVDIYIEAKKYGDMIVFQLQDHYQNLTLKSALMMQWAATRCRTHLQEMMVLKTDDDVLVNPWTLGRVVQHNSGKDLVGYRKVNSYLHRDEYNKWHVPRWLHRQDFVPEYLSGTGYLVKGSRLKEILRAAFVTPIINLEDVYFTYIVAKVKLNLTLTHDHRLSPYKPWLPLECMYWGLASIHSLTSDEILDSWPRIEGLGKEYENGNEKCRYFVDNIWTELYLY